MKQIFYTVYDYIKHTDKLLIALTVAATVFGIIVIAGVHNAFLKAQGVYMFK